MRKDCFAAVRADVGLKPEGASILNPTSSVCGSRGQQPVPSEAKGRGVWAEPWQTVGPKLSASLPLLAKGPQRLPITGQFRANIKWINVGPLPTSVEVKSNLQYKVALQEKAFYCFCFTHSISSVMLQESCSMVTGRLWGQQPRVPSPAQPSQQTTQETSLRASELTEDSP